MNRERNHRSTRVPHHTLNVHLPALSLLGVRCEFPRRDRMHVNESSQKSPWGPLQKTYYFAVFAVWLILVAAAGAQDRQEVGNADSHLGYPQDWSSHHLVITGDGAKDPLAHGWREPRHVYNRVMREDAIRNRRRHPRRNAIKVDWAVSLENGFVPANQFPAKYRFDVSTQSCSGDYVVFALTVASGTQANLVGINNLYTAASPACTGS